MLKVKSCTPKDNFVLDIKMNDGRQGVISIKHLLKGAIFEQVNDLGYFMLVEIDDFGSVCWPNGADIAIERLDELLSQKSFKGEVDEFLSVREKMKGNKNAQIDDEPRSEVIPLRVSATMKNTYIENACKEGKSLSAWIISKLNQ